jgi:hypothetical protein
MPTCRASRRQGRSAWRPVPAVWRAWHVRMSTRFRRHRRVWQRPSWCRSSCHRCSRRPCIYIRTIIVRYLFLLKSGYGFISDIAQWHQQKGKLRPRFYGLYCIKEKINDVAFKLELPKGALTTRCVSGRTSQRNLLGLLQMLHQCCLQFKMVLSCL